jgi:hypothetical protein
VSENKFNATASFDIMGAKTAKEAKAAARRAFKQEYGHKPSNIAAERDDALNPDRWNVIVTDHSSGSLKAGRTLEIPADPDAVDPDEDDDDAPDGWSEVPKADRHSTVGWFKGGFEHQTEDIDIQIWGADADEWGYVFPDESSDEQTEAPRFEVVMVRDRCSDDHDTIRQERGFEDDLPAAREKAREWAEEYTETFHEGADQ